MSINEPECRRVQELGAGEIAADNSHWHELHLFDNVSITARSTGMSKMAGHAGSLFALVGVLVIFPRYLWST